MLRQQTQLPERPQSTVRQRVEDIPHSHALLKSQTGYYRTQSGIDFELKVRETTTNGQAHFALDRRIEAATKARREGKPFGQYNGPSISEMPKKTCIELDIRVTASDRFRIQIDIDGPGIYRYKDQYEVSLRSAVQHVMAKADLQLAAINRNAEQHAARNSGYAPTGMRM